MLRKEDITYRNLTRWHVIQVLERSKVNNIRLLWIAPVLLMIPVREYMQVQKEEIIYYRQLLTSHIRLSVAFASIIEIMNCTNKFPTKQLFPMTNPFRLEGTN